MELPFRTDRPVLHARKVANRFIVIFDYMTFPKDAPAANMSAFDDQGTLLWTTPPHTSMSTDAWVNFIGEDPLRVGNFSGFAATIDLKTGRILDTEFTK